MIVGRAGPPISVPDSSMRDNRDDGSAPLVWSRESRSYWLSSGRPVPGSRAVAGSGRPLGCWLQSPSPARCLGASGPSLLRGPRLERGRGCRGRRRRHLVGLAPAAGRLGLPASSSPKRGSSRAADFGLQQASAFYGATESWKRGRGRFIRTDVPYRFGWRRPAARFRLAGLRVVPTVGA